MSTLFLRGRKVWIGFTDQFGIRRNKPTGFSLEHVERRASGVVFPKHVLEFKRQFDANVVLGRWDFRTKKAPQLSVSELLQEYLQFLASRDEKRSQSTLQLYKLAFTKLAKLFGNCPVSHVTEERMILFRKHWCEIDSPHSAANYLRHLSPAFRWATDKGIIPKSPITRSVRFEPMKIPPAVPTMTELHAMYRRAHELGQIEKDERWGELVYQLHFLFLTGFRSDESCHFKLEQIDFDNRVIRHFNEKGDRWELYPIDYALELFLRSLPRIHAPYLFRYRSKHSLSHLFKSLVTDEAVNKTTPINPRLNVHSLKKAYVSRLIKAGLTTVQAHQLSHHKSFKTTLEYFSWFDTQELRTALGRSRG